MSLLFPAPDSSDLKTEEVSGWRPRLHTATGEMLVCLPLVTAVSRAASARPSPSPCLFTAGHALCMCVNFLQELVSQLSPAKGGKCLEGSHPLPDSPHSSLQQERERDRSTEEGHLERAREQLKEGHVEKKNEHLQLRLAVRV